jgi:selT/selW/selH-like putative selenoprotein
LADDIERRFGITAQLIKGHGGNFIVRLNDQPLFSKKQEGRFPTPEEIAALISEQTSR